MLRPICSRKSSTRWFTSLALSGAFLSAACSDSEPGFESGGGEVGTAGSSGEPQDFIPGENNGSGNSGNEGLVDPGDSASGGAGGAGDGVAECAGVNQEAEQITQPVDVIFIIDNSSSMEGEIRQVQDRINDDFAKIIEESGLDYRVIMIARYGDVEQEVGGSDYPICIRAPLGATDCSDPSNQVLAHNPDKFFHYSADVRSREPLCVALEAFSAPDELTFENNPREWVSIVPNGYSEFLRPEALKHFIVITDDNATCGEFSDGGGGLGGGDPVAAGTSAAAAFHEALLALSPEQFGTAEAPNYRWHSIVGMAEKPLDANGVSPAWQPDEPITAEQCPDGSEAPGTGFQGLSVLTGGLRYPSCRNDDFNAIFSAIAGGVVDGALSCEWEIPPPPQGKTFDRSRVNVLFTPSTGEPVYIGNTATAADCNEAGGWHFDDPGTPKNVVACPVTCELLKNDPAGRVDIEFGCETKIGDVK